MFQRPFWKSAYMPSNAFTRLSVALADVDAQIAHAKTFAGGRRGAPASVNGVARPGRPFTRAATVMLAGALEGYVEALAIETGKALGYSPQQMKDLDYVVGRSHGANVGHIHNLFAQVGMPFVLDTVGWKGLPKGTVRKFVGDLAKRRNQIAHGAAPQVAVVVEVERWRRLVGSLSQALDTAAANRVADVVGTAPW